MKIQIATNKEQSDRLIACGVNPDTADMVLFDHEPNVRHCYTDMTASCNTPAWSLPALMAMLPKELYDESDDMYYFAIAKDMPFKDDYSLCYKSCWFEGVQLIIKRDICPIEACVQMIEWLKENDYELNRILV